MNTNDRPTMTIGVIISTFNNPEWLRKTLYGYITQSHKSFELIIADDGSNEETRELIDSFRENFPKLKHIWQPDNGFQKTKILNKALLAAESDYLIFTDQDCIPRQDFIETHMRYAQPGFFLSGGYVRLPMSISKQLSKEDIFSQRVFDLKWLRRQGLKGSLKNTKLSKSAFFTSLMNIITPTKATWNGCNASGWRQDMLHINGFNEQMQYGGEDREFGERLFNLGIKSKQLRYSVVCVHLDHQRPYKHEATLRQNKLIWEQTRKTRLIQTSYGIQ